jgi:tRNA G18 (ribose-2'-O)-methylase SpoU
MSDTKPRNVIDPYRAWTEDLIREDLQKKAFPYAVLMQQLQGDFNIGTVIRSANIFGAQEVYYIGKRHYDRRGAVGAHHYTNVKFLESMEDLRALKSTYTLIGLDNVSGSVPLESFVWPDNPLMIFGEEGPGIAPEYLAECQHLVSITQYGSVRSLNAASAASIVMYDFVNKYLATQKAATCPSSPPTFAWPPGFLTWLGKVITSPQLASLMRFVESWKLKSKP